MSRDRLSPLRRRIYAVLNASSAPFWLAMLLAPRSALTRRLVDFAPALFLGVGGAYDVLMTAGLITNRRPLDFRDPDAVRAALSDPDIFLAAWGHYIAFDLFVGRWIWEDALERGRSARMALVLTWMAGPAGLSLYLVQCRRGTPAG